MKYQRYHVTKHARERFRERFFLHFPKYFSHIEDTNSIIIAQVEMGQQMQDWKMVPFYVNRMSIQHGPNIEIFKRNNVYVVCQIVNGVCSIRTCAPRILYYK